MTIHLVIPNTNHATRCCDSLTHSKRIIRITPVKLIIKRDYNAEVGAIGEIAHGIDS